MNMPKLPRLTQIEGGKKLRQDADTLAQKQVEDKAAHNELASVVQVFQDEFSYSPTGYVLEDFESTTKKLPFTGGNWLRTKTQPYEGNYCFTHDFVGHGTESSIFLNLTFAHPGTLSFYYRTSTEEYRDQFQFYADGGLKLTESGEKPWKQFTMNVTAGTHQFKWRYSRDISSTSGENQIYIDKVEVTGLSSEPVIGKAAKIDETLSSYDSRLQAVENVAILTEDRFMYPPQTNLASGSNKGWIGMRVKMKDNVMLRGIRVNLDGQTGIHYPQIWDEETKTRIASLQIDAASLPTTPAYNDFISDEFSFYLPEPVMLVKDKVYLFGILQPSSTAYSGYATSDSVVYSSEFSKLGRVAYIHTDPAVYPADSTKGSISFDPAGINPIFAPLTLAQEMHQKVPALETKMSTVEKELLIDDAYRPVVSNYPASTTASNPYGFYGNEFKALEDLTVYGLDYTMATNTVSIIRIWDLTSSTVFYTTATMNTGTFATTGRILFTTPLTLLKDRLYAVGLYQSGTNSRYVGTGAPALNTGKLQFIGAIDMYRGLFSDMDSVPSVRTAGVWHEKISLLISNITLRNRVATLENGVTISTDGKISTDARSIQGKTISAPTAEQDGYTLSYDAFNNRFNYVPGRDATKLQGTFVIVPSAADSGKALVYDDANKLLKWAAYSNSDLFGVKQYQSSLTPAAGATNLPINIPEFTKGTDVLEVYQNGIRLFETESWTVSEDGASINLVTAVTANQKFRFVCLKAKRQEGGGTFLQPVAVKGITSYPVFAYSNISLAVMTTQAQTFTPLSLNLLVYTNKASAVYPIYPLSLNPSGF